MFPIRSIPDLNPLVTLSTTLVHNPSLFASRTLVGHTVRTHVDSATRQAHDSVHGTHHARPTALSSSSRRWRYFTPGKNFSIITSHAFRKKTANSSSSIAAKLIDFGI